MAPHSITGIQKIIGTERIIFTPGDAPDSLEFTILATEVDSDQATFNTYVPVDDSRIQNSPGFLNACIAGMENLTVWDMTKTNEFPRHVHVEVDLSAGQVWFRFENLSSTVDNVFYFYPDPSMASDYAVTDAKGRNAAFQEFEAFWGMEDDPAGGVLSDWTGNGNEGTPTAGITKVSGKIGSAWSMPGTNSVRVGNLSKSYMNDSLENFTLGAWFTYNGQDVTGEGFMGILSSETTGGNQNPPYSLGSQKSLLRIASFIRDENNNPYSLFSPDNSIVANAYSYTAVSLDLNGNIRLYLDGINVDNNTYPNIEAGTEDFLIGATKVWFADRYLEGDVSIAFIRDKATNTDLNSLEYKNQNSPATFLDNIQEVTF